MSPTPDQHIIDALIAQMDGPTKHNAETNGQGAPGTPARAGDNEVIEKCRAAKNAEKFTALFNHGDVHAYHAGDDSRADLSLIGIMAFYTQEPGQLDRLFRRSALYRPKWDERRAESTYGRRTIDTVLGEIRETYTWPDEVPIDSHHTHTEFGENKPEPNKPLPIKTVEEVIEEAGEEVPWIVEDLLARGALTEFSGVAKDSGKTTFWCHAIAAGAREEEHAGLKTVKARYLYLTEQGNNFALALRDSGLTECPEHIRIVQFKDVLALQWNTLMHQAGAEAKRRNLDVLAVDTFTVFARLRGAEENDAGPVADRMRVLREVAQKHDIAVLLIRHSGKDGTPRGSSAFEAEADICATLGKPEGRHAPSVRRLSVKGRYGVWERNVQLADGRFVSLGTDSKIEFNRAVRFIKAILPQDPAQGVRKQDILEARVGEDAQQITASTLDRALTWLVGQDAVGEKQLTSERGKPKIYWLKPDGVYFHQTPPPIGENKKKPPAGGTDWPSDPTRFYPKGARGRKSRE